MRRVEKKIGINIYTLAELPKTEQLLFKKAIEVRENAQAPYSHYKVGCAVFVDGGHIFTGVNVERNTWTQTTHAEQNAIDNAISELGPVRIMAIAVAGAPEGKKIPLTPPEPEHLIESVDHVCPSCGHCLQIILENCFDKLGYYDPDVVLLGAHNGEFYSTTIGSALPMPFLPQYLGTNYAKLMEQRARERK